MKKLTFSIISVVIVLLGVYLMNSIRDHSDKVQTVHGAIIRHPVYSDTWGIEVHSSFGRAYRLAFYELPKEFQREGMRVGVTYVENEENYDNTPGWRGLIHIVDNRIEVLR